MGPWSCEMVDDKFAGRKYMRHMNRVHHRHEQILGSTFMTWVWLGPFGTSPELRPNCDLPPAGLGHMNRVHHRREQILGSTFMTWVWLGPFRTYPELRPNCDLPPAG